MGSSCPLFRPSFSTCLLVQTSLWYDLFKDVPRTSPHRWAPLWALDSPVAGGKTLCLGSILSPSDPSGTGQTQSPASPTAPTPGLLFSSPSLCSKPHCGREPASCSLRGGQHLGSCSTSEGLQAVRNPAHIHIHLLLLCKPQATGPPCCCLDHVYLPCLVVQLPKKHYP